MKFVGEILRNKRLSKKYSLEDISSELKISKYILKSIESDELDNQINDIFYIGHLRTYANFLGLNSSDLVNKFKIQNSLNKEKENKYIPKPQLNSSKFFILRFSSFFSILIIFLSFYVLFISNDNHEKEYAIIPDIPENSIPIIEKTEIEISKKKNSSIDENKKFIELERSFSSSSVSAAQDNNNTIINDSLITLKILNPTWIQLRDKDDKIIVSKLMTKNEEYSYYSKLNYSITSGNGGNILVLIDNKIRGKISNMGQVVDSFVIDNSFNN